MKKIISILLVLFCSLSSYAEDSLNERVYVHLDKDCYLAGENILVKFYTVNHAFQPSALSKVGYIEISDEQRPHIQYKIALEEGRGAGAIAIPHTVPTGIYQLTAYTRYMRNENEDTFFKSQIAIINMTEETVSERVELTSEPAYPQEVSSNKSTFKVNVDKAVYGNRQAVQLSLANLPDKMNDVVISVVRNDSITYLPPVDDNYLSTLVSGISPIKLPCQWLPEYEGHIITGEIVTLAGEKEKVINTNSFASSIGFAGKDIRALFGRIRSDNTIFYYTEDVYGKQDVVTSLLFNRKPATDHRVDIVSPFAGTLLPQLSKLQISPEDNRLLDRFVGVQLNQLMFVDSLGVQTPVNSLYDLTPMDKYDLDEYTRFNSVRQTIIEFILRIVVRKIDGESRLRVFIENEKRFNQGNTLVLLDGVPLFDHEHILNYNPYLIKKVNIYDGNYAFGGEFYDCMVSFVTYRGDLPSIQLGVESQLFVYDCPELPVKFDSPDYSNVEAKNSSRPDFRHTLYWEPFGERLLGKQESVVFYTSDLTGQFKVVVEGITKEGKKVSGSTLFEVKK